MHDGFYLQMSLGTGFLRTSGSQGGFAQTISGGTVTGSLWIGGSVIPGLAIGGGILGAIAPKPHIKLTNNGQLDRALQCFPATIFFGGTRLQVHRTACTRTWRKPTPVAFDRGTEPHPWGPLHRHGGPMALARLADGWSAAVAFGNVRVAVNRPLADSVSPRSLPCRIASTPT
jgi:hypothetical protein